MIDYHYHLINHKTNVLTALSKLNSLAPDAILFVVDVNNKLLGSLTDGDVRRGLLKGLSVNDLVSLFIEPNPKFIKKDELKIEEIIELRKKNYTLIPVLNDEGVVVKIVNLRLTRSYLPIDVVIMAGGRGERLRPLTDTKPKPMLNIGEKPIIEHNIDRLAKYGIENIWISIKYLGEQIVDHFKDGLEKQINIQYISEENPLGTLGAVSLVNEFANDTILVMNSDLLNNVNFEAMYIEFNKSNADLMIATIPYEVNIPYAVLDIEGNEIIALKEKPVMTYLANGGIYLMKKNLIDLIPYNEFYNATDLIEHTLKLGYKIVPYNHIGYWLDIGKHEDYKKAQDAIKHLKL